MTIDLNRLKTMSKQELIDIAKQVNAPYHHKNSEHTLVENIINKVMAPVVENAPKAQEKAEKVTVFVTEDELESALASIKDARKAFSTTYDHEAQAVTFKYNDGRYRHAETISLSAPLTKLKRHAETVARGPLVLRSRNPEDFGGLISAPDGKNAYTNAVL